MLNYRSLLFVFAGTLLLSSGCVKETYFGKSAFKKILYFTVSNETGTTSINQDSLIIRLNVDAKADLTKLFADSVQLSTYAQLSPGVRVPQDFSKPVRYTVIAEDGSQAVYTVLVTKQSANPQLSNSNFNDWYTPNGKNYKQPGLDANTEWATGNDGVVSLSSANTTPVEIAPGDLAAKMVTKDLGVLAQLTGQRMGAGTLFTGTFKLDLANPLNSAKFGIAYTSRPKSFTVSYKYAPGTVYKNGSGQVLNRPDSCDIYLLLENRNGQVVKRAATAWFRSPDTVNDLTKITIPLVYGTLPAGSPGYQLPANGLFADANEAITHLSIIFSSSASGAKYEGGVNSTLEVDNLVLNY
ncbi:PCMD domain-containing protein [Pedobacter sp. PLR]|uniref:PCMD domain-containing protein n=1 Tax=Pedobacter sp. PLR TaxID=2994465 RepID=UPI002245FB75|nr:PCMD domain-containing protein [Pedobacter sp. PLR]MCX2453738.1 PCMD domain-containing protein [Pedobacter sp. PLR]